MSLISRINNPDRRTDGWARPAGKWHIFADDVSEFTEGRVSVCRSTGLGRIRTFLNAPTSDRICRKCLDWNKAKQATRRAASA